MMAAMMGFYRCDGCGYINAFQVPGGVMFTIKCTIGSCNGTYRQHVPRQTAPPKDVWVTGQKYKVTIEFEKGAQLVVKGHTDDIVGDFGVTYEEIDVTRPEDKIKNYKPGKLLFNFNIKPESHSWGRVIDYFEVGDKRVNR